MASHRELVHWESCAEWILDMLGDLQVLLSKELVNMSRSGGSWTARDTVHEFFLRAIDTLLGTNENRLHAFLEFLLVFFWANLDF